MRVVLVASWNLWSDYFESDDDASDDDASDGGVSDDGASAEESSDPRDRFPTLRVRGPLAVVGLCSALPTRLFNASGTLGDAQLERLERMLHRLSESDLCRVISIHHPITAGATHERRWLRDAESLRGVICRAGADLVVHGHNHRPLIAAVDGPDGSIPSTRSSGIAKAEVRGFGSRGESGGTIPTRVDSAPTESGNSPP